MLFGGVLCVAITVQSSISSAGVGGSGGEKVGSDGGEVECLFGGRSPGKPSFSKCFMFVGRRMLFASRGVVFVDGKVMPRFTPLPGGLVLDIGTKPVHTRASCYPSPVRTARPRHAERAREWMRRQEREHIHTSRIGVFRLYLQTVSFSARWLLGRAACHLFVVRI